VSIHKSENVATVKENLKGERQPARVQIFWVMLYFSRLQDKFSCAVEKKLQV